MELRGRKTGQLGACADLLKTALRGCLPVGSPYALGWLTTATNSDTQAPVNAPRCAEHNAYTPEFVPQAASGAS